MDGTSASMDFPCDPDAEASIDFAFILDCFDRVNNLQVSACCGPFARCESSLYCNSFDNHPIGSCTDRLFKDNACPFQMLGLTLFSFQNTLYSSNHQSVWANILSQDNGLINNQSFTYANNATICQDSTVCPNPGNQTCCSSGAGKREILFHYGDYMPTAAKDLSSFYARAGYTLPSSTTLSSGATVSISPTWTGSSINRVLTSATSASRNGSISSKQSTSPDNPTSNSASSGLSSSAKAGVGIGIGIGLGIALLFCVSIVFLRRHRKRKVSADLLDSPSQARHWPDTAREIHSESVPAEMNGSGRRPFEMTGEPSTAELG